MSKPWDGDAMRMKPDTLTILSGKAEGYLFYDAIRFDAAKKKVELLHRGFRVAYLDLPSSNVFDYTLTLDGLSGFCRIDLT